MEHIDALIDDLIAREGDYVNDPADRGGPTRWGITEAVARRHGYHDKMTQLLSLIHISEPTRRS